MPLNKKLALSEIESVFDFYQSSGDLERGSWLLCGPSGSGKTYSSATTCRRPVHIDSLDKDKTIGLNAWKMTRENPEGYIIADTRWESDDPLKPTVWQNFAKTLNKRLDSGYFDLMGTYILDGHTMLERVIMNHRMFQERAKDPSLTIPRGFGVPTSKNDYLAVRLKIEEIIGKIKAHLPCDFVYTCHLEDIYASDSDESGGEVKRLTKQEIAGIGQTPRLLPAIFSEVYVVETKEAAGKVIRKFITDNTGRYTATSCLKADGKLELREAPNFMAIRRKAGLKGEHKPYGKELMSILKEGGDKT